MAYKCGHCRQAQQVSHLRDCYRCLGCGWYTSYDGRTAETAGELEPEPDRAA